MPCRLHCPLESVPMLTPWHTSGFIPAYGLLALLLSSQLAELESVYVLVETENTSPGSPFAVGSCCAGDSAIGSCTVTGCCTETGCCARAPSTANVNSASTPATIPTQTRIRFVMAMLACFRISGKFPAPDSNAGALSMTQLTCAKAFALFPICLSCDIVDEIHETVGVIHRGVRWRRVHRPVGKEHRQRMRAEVDQDFAPRFAVYVVHRRRSGLHMRQFVHDGPGLRIRPGCRLLPERGAQENSRHVAEPI